MYYVGICDMVERALCVHESENKSDHKRLVQNGGRDKMFLFCFLYIYLFFTFYFGSVSLSLALS